MTVGIERMQIFSISIIYAQPHRTPLLVMATRVLSFTMSFAAHSVAKPACFGFCREQSHNSAGAWSNW